MMDIKPGVWEKYWSLNMSIIQAAALARYYTDQIEQHMGKGFSQVLIFSYKGHTSCYLPKAERKIFGEHMIARLLVDPVKFKEFCDQTVSWAGEVRKKAHEFDNSPGSFKHLSNDISAYTGFHMTPRCLVDFLPKERAAAILKSLEHVRLQGEKVHTDVDAAFGMMAEEIAKRAGYTPKQVSTCTPDEIESYLSAGKLPQSKDLDARYTASMITAQKGSLVISTGQQVSEKEHALFGDCSVSSLAGQTAYAGIVRGEVKIILDPRKASHFKKGDILVTGMTRPDFLPLMEKAAAVVTDSGGILCHAAIVARELNIPTLIGTGNATKTFRDGDHVEVNATKGTIKKIA